MRKLLYIGGVALLVPFWLVAAVIGMWWLFCTGDVTINLRNESHKYIENIVVSGSGFHSTIPGMGVNYYQAAASTNPRVTLDIGVAFDADGQHYDLPARVHMLPFGDFIVVLLIDEQMKISARTRAISHMP